MFDWFNDPTMGGPNVRLPASNTNYASGSTYAGGTFSADPSAWATGGNNTYGGNNFGGGAGIGGGQANGGSGFGFNANTIGMVVGGIQALGSMWNSYQQHKLAKKSMKLQEEAYRTNLANQTKTYNTALEDRIRARHHTEGRAANETTSYLSRHSL